MYGNVRCNKTNVQVASSYGNKLSRGLELSTINVANQTTHR